jgi:hypothetical protein
MSDLRDVLQRYVSDGSVPALLRDFWGYAASA